VPHHAPGFRTKLHFSTGWLVSETVARVSQNCRRRQSSDAL
jgi:hypothetical protein